MVLIKVILSMLIVSSLVSMGVLWIIDMNKTYRMQVLKTSIFLLSVAMFSAGLLSLFVMLF